MNSAQDLTGWLSAAQGGDPAAFESLYLALEPDVSRFVRRLLRDDPGCADIVQETFLTLYIHLAEIDPPAKLRPYVFRVARNACYDVMRQWGRRPGVSIDDDGAEDRIAFDLRDDAAARRLYYEADGKPKAVGTKIVNREFGFVLLALAQHGTKLFYEGPIARDIVAAVRAPHAKNPGDLSEADLAAYKPIEREPLCGERLGHRVCGMPPPSSGGLAVLQTLTFSAELAGRMPLAAESVHHFAESGRLTFADRARYLADPGFVDMPVRALLDPAYLTARKALIRAEASMGRAAAGELPAQQSFGEEASAELPATTHLSIVDAEGNAVSLTSSIEAAFGSRIMVHGFLLNNQLTDFSFRPEEEGRPVANRVEAGKRPLSSMAPTVIYGRDGRVVALVGSPGGSRIINYVAQAVLGLLAWNLSPGEAVALPHYGSRNGPTELERGTAAVQLRPALERRGHTVTVQDMTSGLSVIQRRGDDWVGAADPRREGTARAE